MNDTRILLATTFGLGHMRPASGTWGSLPPIVLAAALGLAMPTAQIPPIFAAVFALVLVIFSGVCVVAGDAAEARFGYKDPSQVVADETAGQCVPLLWLPPTAFENPVRLLYTLALAFVAFRIFDIVKPWPAHRLQRVPGGWGILLDDLFAGLYALLAVHAAAMLAS